MVAMRDKAVSKVNKRGPKPDNVKIEGGWVQAVRKALKKKRPAEGWPTEGQKYPKSSRKP